LLDFSGKFVLADFGHSKDMRSEFDRETISEGDSSFMAPELLLTEIDSSEYIYKSDIFSLGLSML